MLELPSLRAAVRHSAPTVFEGVVAPFALFYLMLVTVGVTGACLAGLGWSYVALARRLVRRERLPATLILGAATLTFRTVLTCVTGSVFLYFAQPTAGTALLALLLLTTAIARRPFIERLAHDYCPLSPAVMSRPAVRRFFIQLSLLWSFVLLANAGCVMWLLLTSSLHAFVVERAIVSWLLTIGAIGLSVAWFARSMRRAEISVRFGGLLSGGRAGSGLP